MAGRAFPHHFSRRVQRTGPAEGSPAWCCCRAADFAKNGDSSSHGVGLAIGPDGRRRSKTIPLDDMMGPHLRNPSAFDCGRP